MTIGAETMVSAPIVIIVWGDGLVVAGVDFEVDEALVYAVDEVEDVFALGAGLYVVFDAAHGVED